MKKFSIMAGLATAFIIVAGVLIFSRGNSRSSLPLPANYELYTSEGCPHCKNVEDFLSSWEKKDEVKIDKLEIGLNKTNAATMVKRATYCKLPTNQLGIPFLFTPEGKCLSGDTPIIDFFKSL